MADDFDPDKYLAQPSTGSEPKAPMQGTLSIEAFDPDSYLAGSTTSTPSPTASTPSTQQFDPDTYLSRPGSPAPGSTTAATEKEIADRSFFDKPALGAEYTKPQEIRDIAAKHGVDPNELIRLAPYFGARLEGSAPLGAEEAKRTAGLYGQALGFGVPQKIYKKAQSPEMERALDEVQSLSQGRGSWLQFGGELAAPLGPLGEAKTLAGAAGKAAIVGGVAGGAGSSQGQEVAGTLTGAALGGALGGTLHGISQAIANRASTSIEKEAARSLVAIKAPELEKGIEQTLAARAESLPDLEAHVLGTAGDLDEAAASRIVKDNYTPEHIEKALDHGTEDSILLGQRATEEIPEVVRALGEEKATQQLLAQDAIDKESEEFAHYLTGKSVRGGEEARAALQAAAEKEGGTAYLKDNWDIFQQEKAAGVYLEHMPLRPGSNTGALNRYANTLSDAQFVLRDMDNKAGGLGIEPAHRELSRQINRMSYPRQEFRADLDSIFRQARKAGVDEAVVGSDKIYQALDSGNMSGLTQPEADIARRFQDYFRKGLDFVNGVVREGKGDEALTPLSIPRTENYVPYQMKPVRQIADTVEKVIDRLGTDISEVTDKAAWSNLLETSPELKAIAEGIGRLDSKGEATTGPELLARVHDLFETRQGRAAIETRAKAAIERTDSPLPEWMREKNLYKLADSWSANTLQHLYLRKPIEQMASKVRVLEKMGMEVEATYLRNLLTDLQGLRKGTMAETTARLGDSYHKYVDRLIGEEGERGLTGKVAAGVLHSLPEVLSDVNRQVYPNLLGLSPRAIIMNATQPIAKTLPEIGLTPYGVAALTRGTAHALLNFSGQIEKVVQQGLQPAEFVGKFRRAVADGIRRSSLYAVPQEVLNKMADGALFLYSRMDVLNRSITLSTAEVIASDLARGSSHAQASLRKLPRSVQAEVARAGADQAEVARVIASSLNASTQYNYNRASMSEFGRVMGPFFSTFTKWPTATAGEMLAEYREKGLTRGTLRNMEKYLAPFLAFKGLDAVLKNTVGDHGEYSERQQKLIGKTGFASSAPIGNLEAIAKGDFFTPPAVDAILKGVIEPLSKGTKEGGDMKAGLRKGVVNGVQTFMPGSVYVKFLTDDLVTWMTGHRPAGSDFLERTENGTKKLRRELRK